MTNRYSAQKMRSSQDVSASSEESQPSFYFLGIDGGGTQTRALITDAQLNAISEAVSGASNPARVGLREAVSHIRSATDEACALAGVRRGEIKAACVALAGISHPIHFHTMKRALDSALRIANLRLVTDADAALEGAIDGQTGVVIIAGTGSIAVGVNAAGEQTRSGGWGPALGDEGSGYDIARRALRSAAASIDGRKPRTLLTEKICARLGVSDPADLPGVIYSDGTEVVEIASLAEVVAQAAREGDDIAIEILAEAGSELGALAASVIEKLGIGSERFRVACVGSVFKSGEMVLGPLRDAVLKVAPRAEIGEPLFSPTVGAVKIAQKTDAGR
jgi:N-acetylglucosamine kinase-like BadF-type ATPase